MAKKAGHCRSARPIRLYDERFPVVKISGTGGLFFSLKGSMCGRFSRSNDFFSQHANQREFLNELGLSWAEPLPASYNVAPTQEIAAVRANERDQHELVMLRWGLVPGW